MFSPGLTRAVALAILLAGLGSLTWWGLAYATGMAATAAGEGPPGQPDRPKVTGGFEQITVSWSEPDDHGSGITGYKVRYGIKLPGNTYDYSYADFSESDTEATFSNLPRGQEYHAQVKAVSEDGASKWSKHAKGRVLQNNTPFFDDNALATSLSVAEGPESGDLIGAPYQASDGDDDQLVYSLSGEDATVLSVDSASGQISVAGGYSLNYEHPSDANQDNIYSVTVAAADGYATTTIDVTVTVTNADEPGAVSLSTTNPQTGSVVTATLTDPDGAVSSEVWKWQRADTVANPSWSDISGANANSYSVTAGDAAKVLRASVTYRDPEGPNKSAYSTTTAAVTASNRAPVFPSASTTRAVPENSASGAAVGASVSATDADGDVLTYSLSGTDAAYFTIASSTGQLLTGVVLNYESPSDESRDNAYSVTVAAADGRATTTIVVTVTVTNADELGMVSLSTTNPQTGSVVTAGLTDPDGLVSNQTWQWQRADAAANPSWSDISGANTSSYSVTAGDAGKVLRASVTYRDPQGPNKSAYSTTTAPVTASNRAPVFPSASTTRSILENSATGTAVGAPVSATDADGDVLTYSLSGADAAYFTIASSTGQLFTKAALDYESPLDQNRDNAFSVAVAAADGYATTTIDVTVTVTNADEPGIVSLSTTTPQTGSALTASLTDPDGAASNETWKWQRANAAGKPSWSDISGANANSYSVTAGDAAKLLRASVIYRDPQGPNKSAYSTTTTPVTASNRPPAFAAASTTRAVPENSATGTAVGAPVSATDVDGDALTYSLSGTDAASFTVASSTGQVLTGAALDYETTNSYSVKVTASDGQGGSASIQVVIAVTNVSEPPGQPGQPTVTGGFEQLAVSWSAPGNSGPAITGYEVRYRVKGAGLYTIATSSSASTTALIVGLERGKTYQVGVRARNDDGAGPWSPTAETRTLSNRAPVFPSASTTRSVPEDAAIGTAVGAPVSATDADGDALTYTLSGAFASNFSIASSTGQMLTDASLDYETASSYSVKVTVSDGEGGSASIQVSIAVTNVDERPGKPEKPTVTGGVEQLEVSWSAPDNSGLAITGYDVRYRLEGAESYTDATSTPASTTALFIGLERGKTYEVGVRAKNSDGEGPWSPTAEARTLANRVPAFPWASATRSVPENSATGTTVGSPVSATDVDGDALTYALSGTDAAYFAIASSTGQLLSAAPLDYENPSGQDRDNAYKVTGAAADGYGTTTLNVTITVTNADEPGVVSLSTTTPETGSVVTASLTDPDGPVSKETWKWQRADDAANPSWSDISGANASSYPVTAGDAAKVLRASVTYQDPQGPNKSAYSTTTAPVTVSNHAPVFASENVTRSVPENSATGTAVGSPVSATDADGDALTYALFGADAEFFTVASSTGQVLTGASLDYETVSSYSVVVNASDGEGGSASIQVSIAVTNVSEPPGRPRQPTVTGGFQHLAVSWSAPDNPGPAITGYDIRYRAKGVKSYVVATSTPASTTALFIGLERGKAYEVAVRARNDDGESAWSPTAEGLTRPNNPPAFPSASTTRSIPENSATGTAIGVPVSATDADGDVLTYSLSGTDAASFAIASSAGQLLTKAALNYEAVNRFSVTVTANDGRGGSASTSVAVVVTDVGGEAPGRPDSPKITGGFEQLTASWFAPDNTGPAIDGYDVRYRVKGSGSFTYATSSPASTTAVFVGLERGKIYQVGVRARNDEGEGPWSPVGEGNTQANRAPMYSSASVTRAVLENSATGTAVGTPVTATDDDGDALTYTLSGTGAAYFAIASSTGQVLTGTSPDYETTKSYSVMVTASDGEGGAESIHVSIVVTNVSEPPARPGKPTVTGGFEQLEVSWSAPENPGPAITDYDVRYRVKGSVSYTIATSSPASTTAYIIGLQRGKTYQVGVRARNDDGDSAWSSVGEGQTWANRAPAFSFATTSRFVAENTRSGLKIGMPVAASDADGDALVYSLSVKDAGTFSIAEGSGQLVTKAALNYEAVNRFSVTVIAKDGHGGSASTSVSMEVTDVGGEEPGKPDPPKVTGGFERIEVAWVEPENHGPAITSYNVRYRIKDGGSPKTVSVEGTHSTTIISGLRRDEAYQVRVRAINADGVSYWSEKGEGRVNRNRAPAIQSSLLPSQFSVVEGMSSGDSVSGPNPATDEDGDTLRYTLSGDDSDAFAVSATSGRIIVADGVALDYEDPVDKDKGNTYAVTLSAADGYTTTTKAVVIAVTNVDEPGLVLLTYKGLGMGQELKASLTDPDGATNKEAWQWQRASSSANLLWSDIEGASSSSHVITREDGGKLLRVRVTYGDPLGANKRAIGNIGLTPEPPNRAPFFPTASTTRSVPENTDGRVNIGLPVRASDADGDTLTYAISEPGNSGFSIIANSGQLLTGPPLNYEAQKEYAVTVSAQDEEGGSTTTQVTIEVVDVSEPPGQPKHVKVKPGFESINVSWFKPDNTGPEITGYDVRYGIRGDVASTTASFAATSTEATFTRVASREVFTGPRSGPSTRRASANGPRLPRPRSTESCPTKLPNSKTECPQADSGLWKARLPATRSAARTRRMMTMEMYLSIP